MFEMGLTLAEIKELAECAGFFIDMEKSDVENFEQVKNDPKKGLVLMQRVAPQGFCWKTESGRIASSCTTCARTFDDTDCKDVSPLAEE